jgi:L-malate glycosyltransferase
LNLLIISTMKGFSWGGSEELWYETALYAKQKGNDVKVVVFRNLPTHNKFNILKSKGIEVFFIDEQKAILPSLFKRILLKILKKNVPIKYNNRYDFIYPLKPDVILLSQGSATDISFYKDLELFFERTKILFFILSLHHGEYGSLPQFQEDYLKSLVIRAKKNFFVSSRNLEVLERQLAFKIPYSGIVKNPVDVEKNIRMEWPKSEIPLLAVVSRLDINFKGQDILLETISLPKWKDRNFKIQLYGDGPDKMKIAELIRYYNLEQKVFLKGHIKEITDVWKENHLLIMPSLSEGLPLTITDAMLCSRPCLVTDVGDSAYLIDENENGWIAYTASVKALDEALERAWQQREQWEEMGQRAHLKIMNFIDHNPGKTFFEAITTK